LESNLLLVEIDLVVEILVVGLVGIAVVVDLGHNRRFEEWLE